MKALSTHVVVVVAVFVVVVVVFVVLVVVVVVCVSITFDYWAAEHRCISFCLPLMPFTVTYSSVS